MSIEWGDGAFFAHALGEGVVVGDEALAEGDKRALVSKHFICLGKGQASTAVQFLAASPWEGQEARGASKATEALLMAVLRLATCDADLSKMIYAAGSSL